MLALSAFTIRTPIVVEAAQLLGDIHFFHDVPTPLDCPGTRYGSCFSRPPCWIASLTSPIARVTSMSRGQAGVQL